MLKILWVSVLIGAVVLADNDESKKASTRKQPIWNDTFNDILRRDLLTTYDKMARPAEWTNATNVTVKINLRNFELDDIKSVFTAYVWLKMEWNDPKLRWSPADYNNLTKMHFDPKEVWMPDVLLYNSASGHSIDYYDNTQLLVQSNSSVLWVPPSRLEAYCSIDLSYWPYDEHNCTLVMGSWTYDAHQLNIKAQPIETDLLEVNYEWELVASDWMRQEIIYECCPEPYASVHFEFHVRRRSALYRAMVVTPASVVILLALVCFWLPVGSGEKILLNGVNVLLVVSFLLYYSSKLPTMGSHTPYVVMFYSNTLVLITFSIILSVVVLNMTRNKHTRSVPWLVRIALEGWLGKMLLLQWVGVDSTPASASASSGGASNSPMIRELREHIGSGSGFDDSHADDQQPIHNHHSDGGDHVEASAGRSGKQYPADATAVASNRRYYWLLLATAIDRIAFLVYAFVFVIMASVYAV